MRPAAEAGERGGPALSREDFRQVAALAHARAGLTVREEKLCLVSGRLARRAGQLGLGGVADYCRYLRGPEGEAETTHLINALTTNHTAFFREAHHFDHLRAEVLPLVAGRARDRGGFVRLWSSASSSGEEPYSIAAVVRRALGPGPLPGLRVLATDIDTEVLAAARRARYPTAGLAGVPAEYRATLAGDAARGHDDDLFAVPPEVAGLVTFLHLNLMDRWPMRPGYDVIFCRNVFIYFDGPTKAGLVDRFAQQLRPGGFLYLGHTEYLPAPHPRLAPAGRTIYRRLP